ncbi:hypothetical protein [Pyrobaculum sp.]|uniref:hypothetical protein n=1 Tax=Pyrobaculum sp. TaxID=2004705 RepID=UPI003D1305E1
MNATAGFKPWFRCGAVHYVYLALAGGVCGGGEALRLLRSRLHAPPGASSAARRGLRADVFIILAYTRRRRVAEMWEAWLYAVFKPPFNKRVPSAEPRRPPLFYTQRRRDKPVEEPVSMAKYAKLLGVPLANTSTLLAEAPIRDVSGAAPEAYMDKPPPGW